MMSMTNLLFVYTANICRSPMAEGLARTIALEYGLSVEVQSAGTMKRNRPADPHSVAVLEEP